MFPFFQCFEWMTMDSLAAFLLRNFISNLLKPTTVFSAMVLFTALKKSVLPSSRTSVGVFWTYFNSSCVNAELLTKRFLHSCLSFFDEALYLLGVNLRPLNFAFLSSSALVNSSQRSRDRATHLLYVHLAIPNHCASVAR